MKKLIKNVALAAVAASLFPQALAAQAKVTIGTVNNADMIRMQKLSEVFEKENPDIDLDWVILEENTLRQRLTTDIATQGGQFDVVTIGMYETPIWGAKGWLEKLENLPASYDIDDVFPSVKEGLSVDGTLYALPFYGEGSMTYYRTDLFEKHALTMPQQPSWDQMMDFAKKLHDPDNGVYGMCLRGKAGWGENMALMTTIANAFGARWFDQKWKPELDQKAWKEAMQFYVDLLGQYGPPGASSNGFNENLALFNSGKCAMWVDATVAGSFLTDSSQSVVADKVGFSLAPSQKTRQGASWLWAWGLAIPKTSDAKTAAQKFTLWATSKKYAQLVAETHGVAAMPPGTRQSTYANAEYLEKAPFAKMTLLSMEKADPKKPSMHPVPYVGIQFAAIPEFQSIATQVGKFLSGALAGSMTVEQAAKSSQRATERVMKRARYYR
ncbi:ABC transporter substrate-binding protein [Alteromonas sp. a30]|uniref:ABC transporter substrate-binding protein n=1 Tax=Alteromonas sp. a30 TaxID=2730917 RepID=UPI0022804A8D|nr:sugar ABC transporter substrate-binding protein [Alteromonas sp. a30]MCY7296722.1 sugar ABC transporter substrate-binding protein [Alteromonas sp. a30]